VKIEKPGRGDGIRYADRTGRLPPDIGGLNFQGLNRNKRGATIDIGTPAGCALVRRLAARADVLVENFRPGVMDRHGLGWAALHAENPRLVYCSITAFGTEGPLAALPGYDPLMQAYAGLMSINGHPGQEPARVGTSIVDMGTGMWAALGIVAALRERDRTGRAVEVTTALFETALTWVSYHAAGFFGDGEVPQPHGSGTAMIAPYQAFPTADGYAMIGAASDAHFRRLADALGGAELAADPRFVDNPSRVRHRDELARSISMRTQRLKTADLLERLRAAGVPAAPILSVDRVMDEPQTTASGMLVTAPHPRLPDYRAVGLPLRWHRQRPGVRRVPPSLGEHSADVLTWLGYTLDDVRNLQTQGVVQ